MLLATIGVSILNIGRPRSVHVIRVCVDSSFVELMAEGAFAGGRYPPGRLRMAGGWLGTLSLGGSSGNK